MIELYLFYNSPVSGENYHSLSKRLLPLDVAWEEDIRHTVVWPTKALPEMLCGGISFNWLSSENISLCRFSGHAQNH